MHIFKSKDDGVIFKRFLGHSQISRYQLKQVADTEMMIPVDMRGVGEVSLRRGRVWKGHSRLLGTVYEVPSKICVHAACT